MKQLLFTLICLMGIQTMFAQDKKQEAKAPTEKVVIQTSAICDDCKERIENLLNYTKGVTFAELDLVSKKVTVKTMMELLI